MPSFQQKKVLVLGATSGLGRALAAKLLENGTSVIAVGRRKEKLDEFVKEFDGVADTSTDSAVFDITNLKAIPGFAKEMFTKHPDIDSVFLNSGIQRAVDWTKPESVKLDVIEEEILTNYTAYMHLTKAFLPYLQQQAPKATSMVFTTSGLALIPMLKAPNYCATKAALHHMILVLREQLRESGSNVKIIELYPPAVQTELHDHEMGEKGKHVGMPLKDFTEEAFAGLCSEDNEQVAVQMVKSFMGFDTWEQERQRAFLKFAEKQRQQAKGD
nr:putative oxidoreductase dlte [Quercus suber]